MKYFSAIVGLITFFVLIFVIFISKPPRSRTQPQFTLEERIDDHEVLIIELLQDVARLKTETKKWIKYYLS